MNINDEKSKMEGLEKELGLQKAQMWEQLMALRKKIMGSINLYQKKYN